MEFSDYCITYHTGVTVNKNQRMTLEQYREVLTRLLAKVEVEPLKMIDLTAPGNKFSDVNWGICSHSTEVYASPELHTFPKDFVKGRRSTPILPPAKLGCPLSRKKDGGYGCFYTCNAFKPGKGNAPVDRPTAVALYHQMLDEVNQLISEAGHD